MKQKATLKDAQKKLREAEFFLGHIRRGDGIRDHGFEAIDFYLSGFLSATCSIEDKIAKKGYAEWKAKKLSGEERNLLDSIRDNRRWEVHLASADVAPVGSNLPPTALGKGDPRVLRSVGPFGIGAFRIDHAFVEGGRVAEEVVSRCDRVVTLLHRIVAEYAGDR